MSVPVNITLFYNPHNFYSQKVLFLLYEKNVNFVKCEVSGQEQYSSWFLSINPKGELPALKVGSDYLLETTQIIDYLEKTYKNDADNLSVVQPNLAKISHYHRTLSKVPIGMITFGALIHFNMCSEPKLPFTGTLRVSFLNIGEDVSHLIAKYADKKPIEAERLIKKLNLIESKRELLNDSDYFNKILNGVKDVLNDIEFELKSHEQSQWLCGDNFSLADIDLSLLLHRLDALGLSKTLWKNDFQLISNYFEKVQQRNAFQKCLPNKWDVCKIVWSKLPGVYKMGVSAVTATICAVLMLKM